MSDYLNTRRKGNCLPLPQLYVKAVEWWDISDLKKRVSGWWAVEWLTSSCLGSEKKSHSYMSSLLEQSFVSGSFWILMKSLVQKDVSMLVNTQRRVHNMSPSETRSKQPLLEVENAPGRSILLVARDGSNQGFGRLGTDLPQSYFHSQNILL